MFGVTNGFGLELMPWGTENPLAVQIKYKLVVNNKNPETTMYDFHDSTDTLQL